MLQENSPLILIYLNFKGMAQVARQLMCYLHLPFVDVLLDCIEEQKKLLPKEIFETLRGLKIDKTQLPILVHEGMVIEQLFPVMTYICYRFEREDLLGRDAFQKARVQELAEILENRLPHTHGLLFELADKASTLEEELLYPTIQSYFKQVLRNSGYMKEFCDLLMHEGHRQYILRSLTILDFYFVESSSYMIGFFLCLEREAVKASWKSLTGQPLKKPKGFRYIRIMQTFQKFMKSQAYYLKSKDYLEGFPIAGCLMSPSRVKGMNRIWLS